jgi:hypothetical protein
MNPADKVPDPPPGLGLVTVTVRSPATAPVAITILAEICVPAVSTTAEFTVMPAPKSTVVTPARKPTPFTVTVNVCPRTPVRVADPPPGVGFDTVISWEPNVASRVTETLAVILVALLTMIELTDIPAPKFRLVTPWINPVPVIVTLVGTPLPPAEGVTLVMVAAGFVIENPPVRVAVRPPEPEFVIETSLAPVAAVGAIVSRARIWVVLRTATESAIISLPKFTDVAPATKLLPVKTTMST